MGEEAFNLGTYLDQTLRHNCRTLRAESGGQERDRLNGSHATRTGGKRALKACSFVGNDVHPPGKALPSSVSSVVPL